MDTKSQNLGWNPSLNNEIQNPLSKQIEGFSLHKFSYNKNMNTLQKIIDWIKKRFEIIKLSNQIRKLNKPLQKIYQELGQDYVATHKNDELDLNYDKIQMAVEIENQIKEKQTEIDEMKGIIRCVACGERIPNDSTFCPYCGMRQPEPQVKVVRYCSECGTKLEIDERFCHHCGAKVPEDDEVTEEIQLRAPVTEEGKTTETK